MSGHTAVIVTEIWIPSGEDYAGVLAKVAREIEDGVRRHGLAFRLAKNTLARDRYGHWVTHRDGNPLNNDPGNLELLAAPGTETGR